MWNQENSIIKAGGPDEIRTGHLRISEALPLVPSVWFRGKSMILHRNVGIYQTLCLSAQFGNFQ